MILKWSVYTSTHTYTHIHGSCSSSTKTVRATCSMAYYTFPYAIVWRPTIVIGVEWINLQMISRKIDEFGLINSARIRCEKVNVAHARPFNHCCCFFFSFRWILFDSLIPFLSIVLATLARYDVVVIFHRKPSFTYVLCHWQHTKQVFTLSSSWLCLYNTTRFVYSLSRSVHWNIL